MSQLTWDQVSERYYETGVDHGVLYLPDDMGVYNQGVAWNGLVTVTESPSGAAASPQYADNIKYLNLVSAEDFGATVEAFTYPEEFGECDGTASPSMGLSLGQQGRKSFGLSYRTKVGNDTLGQDYGYKIHLIYGALAAPSEKAYATINDSPAALTFSWALTTSPVDVPGFKPTALITIDSTKVGGAALAQLEQVLYGSAGVDPRLPSPAEVLAFFEGSVSTVTPTAPTFNSGTHVITIPSVTGVQYKIDGKVVSGTKTITTDTVVTANPAPGYIFPEVTDDDWFFDFV
jgi:hypothetical protein